MYVRTYVCMYLRLIVSVNLIHDFPIETRSMKKYGNLGGPYGHGWGGGCRRIFEIQTDLSESLQQRRGAVVSEMDSMCLGIAERNKCRGIA